jgi:hypothetical protein
VGAAVGADGKTVELGAGVCDGVVEGGGEVELGFGLKDGVDGGKEVELD